MEDGTPAKNLGTGQLESCDGICDSNSSTVTDTDKHERSESRQFWSLGCLWRWASVFSLSHVGQPHGFKIISPKAMLKSHMLSVKIEVQLEEIVTNQQGLKGLWGFYVLPSLSWILGY